MFPQRRLTKGTLRPFLRKMEAVNVHNKNNVQSMQNKQCHRAAIMWWEMILNDWFTNQTTPACRNTVFFIIDLKTKRLDSIR